LLLALTPLVGSEVLSLKVLAVLLYSVQPTPIYLVAEKVTRSRPAALAAAFTASLSPIHSEMLGWGGYPNKR